MAEQVNHDVVDNSQSMSGSPLVDDVSSTANPASADAGANTQILSDSKPSGVDAPVTALDTLATEAPNGLSGATAIDAPAKPSAGDAASETVEAPAAIEDDEVAIKSNAELTNGLHESAQFHDVHADDASMPDGSVDVSLNSDTEGSRGDPGELKKEDDKHHARTHSVKKPTTFSRVSVTKNFLAKSATATPAAVKAGDKPSPVGTPAQPLVAKPRLIAKTGTALRDVQKTRLAGDAATGPDASKVWNKNRQAAPPQIPKQFTDEELKQQYGIHMASRLQADENDKDPKWADIDDDEDDWAPETVVWMDGTKSTLTPQEAAPALKDQVPPAAVPPQQKPPEAVKPVLLTKKPVDFGPQKTILKPGASAAAALAKQDGTAPTERPSLKAKSPAPTPAKSPWAPLPPIEKVSPINPPVQHNPVSAPAFATQDARAYEPVVPAPPAREMAADTFDRSWREGEGGPRELFNSANGRYEPAPEGRRGSVKPDSHARKPAVLQRPSQRSTSPAGPSAAFQTRSAAQSDASWSQRRGSSVSQGSLPSARRLSKGQDMAPVERRTSTVVGHDLRSSPKLARTEPTQPVFPQQSAWEQQMPSQQSDAEAVEHEDVVKAQERIMREKRELARRRRQEEEERQEAEKQERLKARLAQLEGAGKSRKEREAEATAPIAAPAQPVVSKSSLEIAVPQAVEEAKHAEPANPAEVAAIVTPALEAQTLPPPPDAAQTSPQPATKSTSSAEELLSPLPLKPKTAALPDQSVSVAEHGPRQQGKSRLSPKANPRSTFQQQTAPYKSPASSYSSPGDRKQQPFGRSPLTNGDAFSPWPITQGGNVWGTSGIGNGTFESASSFAPIPMSKQNSSLPPPPGMGAIARPSTSARISPQGIGSDSRSPSLQQQSIAEPSLGFGPPGLDARPDPFTAQGRGAGTSPAPGLGRQAHLPGPIAPPSRVQQSQRQDRLATWKTGPQRLGPQLKADAESATSGLRDFSANETAPHAQIDQSAFDAGIRRIDDSEYRGQDLQSLRSTSALYSTPQSQPPAPGMLAATPPTQQHGNRPSTIESASFVPDSSFSAAHGVQPPQQLAIGHPRVQAARPKSASPVHSQVTSSYVTPADDQPPPPPETSSHPVNSGDVVHPLVKLPPAPPRVKLPPAPSQSPLQAPQQASMPQRPISNWGAPSSSKPLVMQEAWQARFNGLFNRTPIQTETPPSPPKTPPKAPGASLAVAVSSRTVMDEVPAPTGATVSLPQRKTVVTTPEGFIIDQSQDVVSKPTIESMFNEELSFGSLPKIKVAPVEAYAHYLQSLPKTDLLNIGRNIKFMPPIETQSVHEFNMLSLHPKRKEGCYVYLPATPTKLKRLVYHTSGPKTNLAHGPHERKTSGKFNKGGKSRDVSLGLPSVPSPRSLGPSSTPNSAAGSRKTSYQKSTPPVLPPSTPAAATAGESSGKKPSHAPRGHRGGRGGHPAASQSVKQPAS